MVFIPRQYNISSKYILMHLILLVKDLFIFLMDSKRWEFTVNFVHTEKLQLLLLVNSIFTLKTREFLYYVL